MPQKTINGGSRFESDSGTITKDRLEAPRRYKVLLFNDDFTPGEFVISVLVDVFRMTPEQALRVTLEAHRKGVAVCGVYSKDVAESKATEVMDRAKAEQHPLKTEIEPDSFSDSGLRP